MTSNDRERAEMFELLELVCENRLEQADAVRLEGLLESSAEHRKLYRSYMALHGLLHWDTAMGMGILSSRIDPTVEPIDAEESVSLAPAAVDDAIPAKAAAPRERRRLLAGIVSAALVVAVAVIGWRTLSSPSSDPSTNDISVADDGRPETPENDERISPRPAQRNKPDLPLASRNNPGIGRPDAGTPNEPLRAPKIDVPLVVARGSSDETIRAFIAEQLQASWEASEVSPSSRADDAEWVRRVYLDLIGRIPTADEALAFLDDKSPGKRAELVDRLLERPEYVYNWSTVWANLLVGRSPEREEYRTGLLKFLRDGFRDNRPWDELVADMISAEGSPDENGASGFLLAHVNNQAVPATAITAKVFLGTQVHCTQCHDHPFNDAKQNQFWELNSFFKQTAVIEHKQYDPETGRMLQDVSLGKKEDVEAETYYENRAGLLRPAYPIYNGEQIDAGDETDRRKELARMLAAGDKPQIADAYVNRMWKHFFGFGFTNPVDDMGPHNSPTHPVLLDRLAREFVLSGYDQKRLIKWICLSDAYQRTSRPGDGNEADSPELGDLPLFSRVYVKPMTVEQTYDSLLAATGALSAQAGDWDDIERQRRDWLQQFVYAYGTDENDEATQFTGTIPQALMLMNGEMIREALSYERPTQFQQILKQPTSETEKIRQICLSALTRYPTDEELSAIKRLLARGTAGVPAGRRQELLAQGLQDIFWAYLNSSEFALVH